MFGLGFGLGFDKWFSKNFLMWGLPDSCVSEHQILDIGVKLRGKV